jgi:hypothetical protein
MLREPFTAGGVNITFVGDYAAIAKEITPESLPLKLIRARGHFPGEVPRAEPRQAD